MKWIKVPAVSFHTVKKRKLTPGINLFYEKRTSAQHISVLIPLLLIENRVQSSRAGLLFFFLITATVMYIRFLNSIAAFIVAGNCSAEGGPAPQSALARVQ